MDNRKCCNTGCTIQLSLLVSPKMCTTVFPHGNIVHLYHTCRYNRLLKIYTLFICIIHECTLSPWKHCLSLWWMCEQQTLLSLSSMSVQPILPLGNYLKHDELLVTTKNLLEWLMVNKTFKVISYWAFLLLKTIGFLYQVN